MFRPCFLVPTYNNKTVIEQTLDRLAREDMPILLVDDGSEPETGAFLQTLPAKRDYLQVKRLEVNGGKGAAVKAGLVWADELGYTHALQVDADGQHQIDDVPKFMEVARTQPNTLVLGCPVFGEDVPSARLHGRKISQFWVNIETLSGAIRDPLFGFRVYPVPVAAALIRRQPMGSRMDFDPEIAVRLYWEGLEVHNIPTPVIYPEGGVSHFQMIRDNIRISWMHTRLVFGMLLRFPRLLRRRR